MIRGAIGFDGLLLSDDLSMEALSGSRGERAAAAIAAGCDIAVHCNGEPEEMSDVAASVGKMSADAVRRWGGAKANIKKDNMSEFCVLSDEFNKLIEMFC